MVFERNSWKGFRVLEGLVSAVAKVAEMENFPVEGKELALASDKKQCQARGAGEEEVLGFSWRKG